MEPTRIKLSSPERELWHVEKEIRATTNREGDLRRLSLVSRSLAVFAILKNQSQLILLMNIEDGVRIPSWERKAAKKKKRLLPTKEDAVAKRGKIVPIERYAETHNDSNSSDSDDSERAAEVSRAKAERERRDAAAYLKARLPPQTKIRSS